MTRPLPPAFDAVLFDLDGTLVATDRFWIESAERGARRAFLALGLERELPSARQWLSLVGLPLETGFAALFPDLTEEQRRTVLRACVEEEELLLRAGGAPAMPGTGELVRALHGQGVHLGIASNCEASYLEHMLDALELRPLVKAAYCRASPGITSKADMLARLLLDFGTRSAVMIGDRASDRDAAWENGIPHVHCAFGFAQGDEAVEAEGRIAALAELPELLAGRWRWIEHALERVGAADCPGVRLGISGGPAAGKTLFARDAARLLRARGMPAAAVSLAAAFPAAEGEGEGAELDGPRLEHELLGPHAAGRAVPLARPDLLGQSEVPAGAVLILEGVRLLGAKAALGLHRLIHLDLPANVAWRRLAGRGSGRGARAGPEGASQKAGAEAFELAHALEQRHPPRLAADLVLDGTNPLGGAGRVLGGERPTR